MMAVRVLLADDHHVVRQGLRLILQSDPDIDVVGEAASADDAIRAAEELCPDLVLMDLMSPGMNGLAVTAAIRAALPRTRVLILSDMDEHRVVGQAAEAGVTGYLAKHVDASELRRAVKSAAMGILQFSPNAVVWLARAKRALASPNALTPREHDVLCLLAAGLANKEIARNLGIGETTVKSHVRHILAKLGVESRTQAAISAARHQEFHEPQLRPMNGSEAKRPQLAAPSRLSGFRGDMARQR